MEMSTKPGQRLAALGSNITPKHLALLWQRHKCVIVASRGENGSAFTLESRAGMVRSSQQYQSQPCSCNYTLKCVLHVKEEHLAAHISS